MSRVVVLGRLKVVEGITLFSRAEAVPDFIDANVPAPNATAVKPVMGALPAEVQLNPSGE